MDKLLTVKEAAEHLQVPVESVIRLVNSGKLSCWKLGDEISFWRFRDKDMDAGFEITAAASCETKIYNPNGICVFCETPIKEVGMALHGKQICLNCGELLLKAVNKHLQLKRGYLLPSLKENALQKYGDKCYYCGKRLSKNTRSFDHVVPVTKGGKTDEENLVPCCRSCNASKGNKTFEEWKEHPAYKNGSR